MNTVNISRSGSPGVKWGSMKAIAAELAKSELFRDAPESLLFFVIEQTAPRELACGEILLSPERENDYVYVLLSGMLSLRFEAADAPEIRELAPGVSVGELSLIDETPPSAYVVAKVPSRVLPIHRSLLFGLVSEANVVSRNLLRLLTRWIKANTSHIVQDRQRIRELVDCVDMDSQTGLYNRRWLDGALPRLLAKHVEENGQLGVLLIDIDHFKHYNDTQGHQAGDSALVALSNILRATLRPGDFSARFGGDEVVMLLLNTSAEESLAMAERIRQLVESQAIVRGDGTCLPAVAVSIGIAISHAGATPESLMAAADAQLYRAKAEGRNRVCC